MQARASNVSSSRPRPPVAPDSAQPPQPSYQRQLALVAAASKLLGLSDADAKEVQRSGLLAVADKTVAVTPLPDRTDGLFALLITVDTACAVTPSGPTAVLAVLAHAPSTLMAFSAAIGVSPQGQWLVHRLSLVGPDDPQALAEAVVASAQLAGFVVGADGTATQ